MIEIPRATSREQWQEGTWRAFTDMTTGEFSVWLTCPNGHSGGLDDHEIDDDGTVRPSVECPEDGCDFHEYVRLVSWGQP